MINKTFQDRYPSLLPFVGVLILSLYFFVYPKGEVVLMMNRIHSPFWNLVFTKLSSIGNALSIFFFLAIVLWKFELKYLYFFVLAFLLESLIIVLSKNLIFKGAPRPYLFFEAQGILDQVDFVEGIKINKRKSFPSGHTAYSFCMATFFALKVNKVRFSIFLSVFAAFVGMSRMYLVQHFFMDVFTGAVVGISMTCVAYLLVFKTEKEWYNKRLFQKKTR
ncbi:phosphatase PAP2 family protein [Wenyingzhuangia sp. 2_MG-2023]|uniref:phosphatase PAP2 family protein n=1 Tax=Wenyingzhuangia sp. 2_MG-2023 TaxID=3062639 RepID=UPI0026E27FB2|nr:phosphatase PAP2 family protein [Wenyingzhuangia sp. 2_MG-2023]MDO6737815.1 phosphatase PAP2 family protein [Wenyingzhuangia sp. 2_MG-2023]